MSARTRLRARWARTSRCSAPMLNPAGRRCAGRTSGARLKVRDGQKVDQGQTLVEWDPYTFSILTEESGTVKYKDLISDVTYPEEVDEVTGLSRKIVVDSPDEKKQPLMEIRDKNGKVARKYHMPSHAHLMIEDGEPVSAGVDRTVRPIELARRYDADEALFDCCIDLGRESVDTRSNGAETARWVEKVSTGPVGCCRLPMKVARSAITSVMRRPVMKLTRSSQWEPMSPTARRLPPRFGSRRQFQSVSSSSQSWK